MSLAQIFNITPLDPAEIMIEATSVAKVIRQRCHPSQILLFGSAAIGKFQVGSDLDFILIFEDLNSCKNARKLVRQGGILHSSIPVDLLFTTREDFEKFGKNGGPFYTAKLEGITL